MNDAINALVAGALKGGPGAIICILLGIILALVLVIKHLLTKLQKKEEKIEKIVEDYYRGNITLAEALNSLKTVLFEIRNKL